MENLFQTNSIQNKPVKKSHLTIIHVASLNEKVGGIANCIFDHYNYNLIGRCACGNPINHELWVKNNLTNLTFPIGSECIKYFQENGKLFDKLNEIDRTVKKRLRKEALTRKNKAQNDNYAIVKIYILNKYKGLGDSLPVILKTLALEKLTGFEIMLASSDTVKKEIVLNIIKDAKEKLVLPSGKWEENIKASFGLWL